MSIEVGNRPCIVAEPVFHFQGFTFCSEARWLLNLHMAVEQVPVATALGERAAPYHEGSPSVRLFWRVDRAKERMQHL